jgi:hypothetical protein
VRHKRMELTLCYYRAVLEPPSSLVFCVREAREEFATPLGGFAFKRRKAYFRLYPATTQNSFRIRLFSTRAASWYRS